MSYHVWKKAFQAKYPENGSALFNLAYSIMDRFGYGLFRPDVEEVRHANNKAKYNEKGWMDRELRKYDIYQHFCSGGNKTDMLWYTNSLFYLNGVRIFVPMLDFDNKEGAYSPCEMDGFVDVIKSLHPAFENMFCQVSTGGLGRHGYPSFEIPADTDRFQLSKDVKEMSDLLKSKVNILDSIKATFVKRVGKYHIDSSGSLGKLFLCGSDEQAGLIIAHMSVSYPFYEVLESLRGSKTLLQTTGEQEQEGVDCRKVDSVVPVSISNLRQETDTFIRTKGYDKLRSRLYPNESLQERKQAYINAGLNLGNSDMECLEKNFEYGQDYKPQTIFTYEKAEQLYHSLDIKQEDLQCGKSGSLSVGQVAKYIHIMTTTIMKTHHCEKRQFTVGNAYMRNEMKINGSQYKALKALGIKYSLFLCSDESYIVGGKKYGITKKYGLGENHPLCQVFCDLKENLADTKGVSVSNMEYV